MLIRGHYGIAECVVEERERQLLRVESSQVGKEIITDNFFNTVTFFEYPMLWH